LIEVKPRFLRGGIIRPMTDRVVLFSDVAGSTSLYEVLGDKRAFALIEQCLDTMSKCTEELHGRVVKTIGDAVMAVFDDADAAAAAATEMQLRVDKLTPATGVKLGLRIGFHYGPVVDQEKDKDVFGDTVNLASRLCDLASRGQVITSKETAQHLSPLFAANLRKLYAIQVKGREKEVELIEIVWQSATEELTAITAPVAPGAGTAVIELELAGTRIDVGPERRKVTIGRDHEADFTIRDDRVSRAHAMIERRRGHFFLVDHSANGSYVTLEGKPEMDVHREELTLLGHGWITFGRPRAEAHQVLEFRIVETWRPERAAPAAAPATAHA
jgi:adenylate cyclase